MGTDKEILDESVKYEDIYDWENLLAAYRDVSKGRRYDRSFINFSAQMEELLLHIHEDLKHESYIPHGVTEFDIRDPKPRHIIAPRLYDRLVHHALINVTLPVFEKHFHQSSFACRRGKETYHLTVKYEDGSSEELTLKAATHYPIGMNEKNVKELAAQMCSHKGKKVEKVYAQKEQGRGTIYACTELQRLMRKALGKWGREFYIIEIDLKSYFKSINHNVLMAMIDRLFADKRIVALFQKIINAIDEGLPIGFLPSQHEANLVATAFDYFITDTLGYSLYVRYMDDMRVLCRTREEAKEILAAVDDLAVSKLALRLSENKTRIVKFKGFNEFCGFKVYPHHLDARKKTLSRHERRVEKKARDYLDGRISFGQFYATLKSAKDYVEMTESSSAKLDEIATKIFEKRTV